MCYSVRVHAVGLTSLQENNSYDTGIRISLASCMPPKKSYDFSFKLELDLVEIIEMRHLFEGSV